MKGTKESAFRAGVLALGLAVWLPRAEAGIYYGSKWAADSLANTTIGPNIQGDYRFRATHSGPLASIHTFFICKIPGYAAGTLGSYRIDLETDDGTTNHFPSGTVLATTHEPTPGNQFVTETFASPATLTSGTLYHLVYTNIDPTPTANYCSLDMLYDTPPVQVPAQPTVADSDWAHLYNNNTVTSPTWIWRHGNSDGAYMPVLELVYGDGFITGNGYMEVWINTSRKTISGTNEARETFTVSGGNQAASNFSVRLRKDSGTDPLTVTLQTAGGSTLESGTIPAANFSSADAWVTYTFIQTRTLANGSPYTIVLSAPGTSSYSIFPIRKGITHNFDAGTFFNDGHAQYSSDGLTWNDWPAETGSPSTEGDLQFYFTLAGASPPPGNSCDVNGDGHVDILDVQMEVNMVLQTIPCTNPTGSCTVVSVQRVVNAVLTGQCPVAP
jgi:hypothetical protein